MSDVFVVQFPHPGPEHNARGFESVMPWNAGNHARKFLRSPATWVDESDVAHEGAVTFWGEWEPPSRIVERWGPDGRHPRFLHEPFVGQAPVGFRQNTDPWVFGDTFRYSNCKQGSLSSLRRLTPGSLLLFGSGVGDAFVLDTVLVVKSGRTYVPAANVVGVDEAFHHCTIDSLNSKEPLNQEFVLYDGASWRQPVAGMFSFVPCEREGGRFARPAIRLPGVVNPRSKQSPNGVSRPVPVARARECWTEVVRQVRAADLDLAVRIETPPTA